MVQVTRNRETRSMAKGGKFLDFQSMKEGEMVAGVLVKEGVGTLYPKPNYTLLVEKSTMTGKNACNAGDFVVLNWSNILEQGIQELRKATNKNLNFYVEFIYEGYTAKKNFKKGDAVSNKNHYHKADVRGDPSEFSAPSVTPAVIDPANDGVDLE